jgi:hypothetical protein
MTPMDEVARLLGRQSGVIARRQLLAHGVGPAGIERALRRRDLVRIVPGVFLDHTGEPTWLQRAWAGVLYAWPAALGGHSALRAVAGPGWRHHDDQRPAHVAVDVRRTVRPQAGVRPVRVTGLDQLVLWNTGPPRVRPEVAAIAVVAEQSDPIRRIALLADLWQGRHTTPPRLLAALDATPRVRDRIWIRRILTDLGEGTCSVLEHTYLTRVERAHGLPCGRRQFGRITAQGLTLRDVAYERFGLEVELDGRLFHDSAGQRDRDLERDFDAAVAGVGTVRLGWGQVLDRPCHTAVRLARLLHRGGWPGLPKACGAACAI